MIDMKSLMARDVDDMAIVRIWLDNDMVPTDRMVVQAVADRHELIAECERLREALREIGHDCMVSTSEAEVLDEIASVVDAALASTEPKGYRPMGEAPKTEGVWIVARRIEHHPRDIEITWDTCYSIHGLGGHWTTRNGGQYGDMHFSGWHTITELEAK